MRPIAIVDYDVGNLRSVQKGLEHAGRSAEVTSDPARIADAPGVVLPGQGHFGTCMDNLAARGLVDVVRGAARSGRPFLGICVGMQILFDSSAEAPGVAGLGIFQGAIVRFAPHAERKVPHMGWNQLQQHGRPWALEGIDDGANVYFVHSYYPVPASAGDVATSTEYGETFCSSVIRDNVYAGVFHPEKSQRVGLRLLANFVARVGA